MNNHLYDITNNLINKEEVVTSQIVDQLKSSIKTILKELNESIELIKTKENGKFDYETVDAVERCDGGYLLMFTIFKSDSVFVHLESNNMFYLKQGDLLYNIDRVIGNDIFDLMMLSNYYSSCLKTLKHVKELIEKNDDLKNNINEIFEIKKNYIR